MSAPRAATAEVDKPKTNNGHDGPRSRKGARTRARLVEAAREVFERDGFLTARISDIAATAGLSQGSFYHYFESKEQIFREVAEAQEERLTAPLGDALAHDQDESVQAAIAQDIRRYLERYREAARLMAVIEQVSRYDDQVNAARMATQEHFSENAQRIIRGLQRQGRYDTQLDPIITADALGSMVGRFAELWLVQHHREYDLDEVVEQLTILCVNALGLREDPVT